ncbi:MAG TPA: hypothetical protein PLZ15_11745 [Melioribacteraceae bacterium]|nr:hypothetical protein [Melioribacteraceae bacterium]
MKSAALLLLIFLFQNFQAQSLNSIPPGTKLINGYTAEIEGENLPYRSSYPEYARVALLTRVTDGNKIICWETDVIPNTSENFLYIYWLGGHSSGTSKADRNFDLSINGEKILTFITPMKRKVPFSWNYKGKNNIELFFDAVKQDAVDDVFGNVYLKIPNGVYPAGRKLRISVAGQNENSPDWYMTFKYSYKEKIDISPIPAIIRQDGKLFRAINIKVDHIGNPSELVVNADNKVYKFRIEKGFNDFDLTINNNDSETELTIDAEIKNFIRKKQRIKLKPTSQREIHLISHSHSDIGYSNLQEEVIQIQNKNIDDALKYIEKSERYPDEARYKWNIESLWALENYLSEAPEGQKAKLIRAIKSGSIGLSALYSHNLTGITKPEEFDWLIEYSKRIEKEFGLDISNAMITDIPGINWSLIATLTKNGIKYFSSGQNYFTGTFGGGDRVGHSNYAWGDKPFYWQSPDGKGKVLFWMAGRGYSYFHSFGRGDLFRRGKEHIFNYLNDLDSTKYPYDIIQLRYSIRGDNGPTDSTLSDFVKQWNEKYYSPKIILSTVDSMFKKFEWRYGSKLGLVRGEFNPYWEDGAYSTAHEENLNRLAADRIVQYGILSAIINPRMYDSLSAYEARKNVVLFHEHTWGAWNSISEPDNPFVIQQWNYKSGFAYRADRQSKSLLEKLLSSVRNDNSGYVSVFNTCSWERSDIAYIDSSIAGSGNSVADENLNPVPSQLLSDGRIAFLADKIPPLGSRIFKIVKQERNNVTENYDDQQLLLDLNGKGRIKNLYWNSLPLLDPQSLYGFNSVLYVPGKNPKDFIQDTISECKMIEDGLLLTQYKIRSYVQGADSIIKKITLLKPFDKVMVNNVIYKKSVREKESVHLAFPFSISNPRIRYDIGRTYIQPDSMLIDGANKDFFSVNKWIDISNGRNGITLFPMESSLFEIGDLVDEDNSSGSKIWKNTFTNSSAIFAYVMNNYWHTNYKADQSGKTEFNFLISPHNNFDEIEAYRTGTGYQSPLVVSTANKDAEAISLFSLSSPSVILSSITPQKKSLILKLFNVSRLSTSSKIIWNSFNPEKLFIVKDGEEFQINGNSEISFNPFEVITIRAEYDQGN